MRRAGSSEPDDFGKTGREAIVGVVGRLGQADPSPGFFDQIIQAGRLARLGDRGQGRLEPPEGRPGLAVLADREPGGLAGPQLDLRQVVEDRLAVPPGIPVEMAQRIDHSPRDLLDVPPPPSRTG